MTISRGDIFYIMPADGVVGSEQQAGRPAIIVSNDQNNAYSSTVEVVFLTTQPKTSLPTHVTIRSSNKISTALCEQVQTVSTLRLGSYCAACTAAEMEAVDRAIKISLALDTEPTITAAPTVAQKVTSEYEKVDHPDHYQSEHGMECIDAMRVMFGDEAVLAFCRVTAYKYRFRAGLKPGEDTEDDIAKAEWYEAYARDMLDSSV